MLLSFLNAFVVLFVLLAPALSDPLKAFRSAAASVQGNLRTEALGPYTYVPVTTGYIQITIFDSGTTVSAKQGYLLNTCLPIGRNSDKYAILSVLKVMSGTTNVGLQPIIPVYYDSFCTNSTGDDYGGGPVPPIMASLVTAVPATTTMKGAVWFKQYTSAGATGTVTSWFATPYGKSYCQDTGPLTDVNYVSCNSTTYTVKVDDDYLKSTDSINIK